MDGIVELGLEALNLDPYNKLVISKRKIISLANECISSANNFAWVVEHDNKIKGAVCALIHPIMFYEKSQASVLQFYCKVPGAGIKLLRTFMEWVDSRPVIKLVVFTLEGNADPRIGKLLNRLGLKKDLPVYIKVK